MFGRIVMQAVKVNVKIISSVFIGVILRIITTTKVFVTNIECFRLLENRVYLKVHKFSSKAFSIIRIKEVEAIFLGLTENTDVKYRF